MTLQLVLDWAALLPVAALLVLALYAPGVGALVLLRTRLSVALAGGPLLTASLLGIGGVVLHTFGIRYNALSYLVLVLMLWGMALLVRLLLSRKVPWRRHVTGSWVGHHLFQLSRLQLVLLLGALALGVVSMWVPTMLMTDPAVPNPRVDPMYHYNVLNSIGETGSVSMFAAVDYTYGIQVRHVTYPTVWHALSVLAVPLIGIVPAANLVAYIVTPALFVLNIALLTRIVFRRQLLATAVGAIAAGILPAFPGGLAFTKSFWPNELAVAMLPGLLVVLIMFLRRCRWGLVRRRPGTFLLDLMVMLAAAGGLGLTHPSVFFSFVIIVLPLLIFEGTKAHSVVRRSLSPRARNVLMCVLTIVVITVVLLLLIPDQVRSFLMRDSIAQWNNFTLKGISMVANWPTDVSNPAGVLTALVYIPLLLVGIALLSRRRDQRWIVWAWVLQIAVIIGSYFPVPGLSALAGLWYADTFRLYAIQAVILPLAVAAVVIWAHGRKTAVPSGLDKVPSRVRKVWAWGAVLAALSGTTYITAGGARQVGVGSTSPRPVPSAEEAALLDRIGEDLPDGSLVVGDPATGVAYLPITAEVESVFTQMNVRDVDEDGIFLMENFDDIATDPRVCEVLGHYGVGYFYQDVSFEYNYSERAEVMPGFYSVDTSEGFTLVDEAEDSKLWRIDACGPVEAPGDDWWNREKRIQPFIEELGP